MNLFIQITYCGKYVVKIPQRVAANQNPAFRERIETLNYRITRYEILEKFVIF